jgi:FHA domain
MDLAGKAQKIERKLARSLDAAIGELIGRDDPAPLEIVHAVLDRAEREIQEIGRGRRVFPFTRVRVLVLAEPRDRDTRARLDAVIAGPPSLAERLGERLAAAGCPRARIATEIAYVKQRGGDWQDPRFHVTFDRADSAGTLASRAPAAPRLKLAVVKGRAAQRAYVFAGGRIDIGRRAEVIDQRQRLIRTNQVAFAEDGADENQSVSRRHAHIEFTDGGYRIWDDRSAHGTSLIRSGRTIKVAAGARGTRLLTGDEIVLGHARVRVAIE